MLSASRPRFEWQLRTRKLPLGERTLVMGIVNVTPNSFSDGGRHSTTSSAVEHALCLLDEGADILDIGGESTRPGSAAGTAHALAAEEEQQRALPVIERVLRARPNAILSVDTYRASTAEAAIRAGAEIVNDVSGLLWDPAMAATLASQQCGVVLMHTRGLPSAWAGQPALEADQVAELVRDVLQKRLKTAGAAGISRERIVLDPGFGFGKRGTENWALLRNLAALQELHRPLLVGLSRKGFLAHDLPPEQRDSATHAAGGIAVSLGAHILRVHDVAGAIQVLRHAE